MPTKRGHIGKRGSEFVIQFSRPGHDVDTAPPEGLVFNSAEVRLRPLVTGSLPIAGRSSTSAGAVIASVVLPKSFFGLPLLFVDCSIAGEGVKGPGRGYSSNNASRRDFEVEYKIGDSHFTIYSYLLTTETFYFSVFDNEMT
jgi:hypothetical protein